MKRPHYIFFVGLAFLLGLIYFNNISAGFLPWDDDYNIPLNPYFLQGQWLEIWNHFYFGMYIPLTSSLWGFLFALGKGSSIPFRVFNLSLHLLNSYLVFEIAKLWFSELSSRTYWFCLFAALFFLIHPLQVDAVAWVSGGRDLLASFFALLSLLCFLKLKSSKGFWLAGGLFVLSLLSKPQEATLPLVIFLISLQKAPHLWKKQGLKMLAWCAPVFLVALVTYLKQKEIVLPSISLWQRPFVMFDSFGFYLAKIIWPFPLNVDYGRTPTYFLSHFTMEWFPTFLLLISFSVLIFLGGLFKKSGPLILFLCALSCLLPVSGLVDFAFQSISTTANHYVYFSMVFFILFFLEILKDQKISSHFIVLGFAALAAGYTWASRTRVQSWQNSKIFFETILDSNPDSRAGLMGLAQYLSDQENNHLKALELFEKVLRQKPKDIIAISNISTVLLRLKRFEAVADMESWLFDLEFQNLMPRRNVDSANFLNSLGLAMANLGRADLGLLYICQADDINPIRPGFKTNVDKLIDLLQLKSPGIVCPHFVNFTEFINAAFLWRYRQKKDSR